MCEVRFTCTDSCSASERARLEQTSEADRTGGQSRADAARVFTRVGARRELRSQFLENARGPGFYDLQYRGTCVQAKHTRTSKRKA